MICLLMEIFTIDDKDESIFIFGMTGIVILIGWFTIRIFSKKIVID